MKSEISKKNIYIVGLIVFLNALTLGAIIPIIYVYASEFRLDDRAIGMLFGTFSFAQFFATPMIGRLSDKYGRKPLLLISLFGTFIASLVQAFATNGWMLFVGRFLDGITGGNNSVAQSVIADSTNNKNKPFGFAVFGASFGLGFLFGPIVSLVIARYDNSYIFLFSALLAFITTLITYFLLPETNQYKETKKIDIIDILFLQIFKALKMPIIKDIIILNFITAVSIAIFQIAFQPYIRINFGFGQEYVSYVLILNGVISISFLSLVNKIVNKYGLFKLIDYLFFFRFISFLGLSLIINSYIFWVVMIIFAFVNLFNRPVILSMLTKYAKKEDQGVVIGVAESLFSLGLAVGPYLFTVCSIPLVENFDFLGIDILTQTLVDLAKNYTLSFYLISVISLLSLIYAIGFTKNIEKKYAKYKKEIDF